MKITKRFLATVLSLAMVFSASATVFGDGPNIIPLPDTEDNLEWETRDMTVKSSIYDASIFDDDVTYQETAMFYKGRTEYKLLYPIDEIITVRSYDLVTEYEEGVDFIIQNGILVLTENSSIPLYNNPADLDVNSVNMWSKAGEWGPKQWKSQLCISYTHSSVWDDNALYVKGVNSELNDIDKFHKKALSGETTNIVLIGDSIAEGCNASGMDTYKYEYTTTPKLDANGEEVKDANGNVVKVDVPAKDSPYVHSTGWNKYYGLSSRPAWANNAWSKQIEDALNEKYSGNILLTNRGIGSTSSNWFLSKDNIDFLLGEGEGTSNLPKPDLAIIAYGMNEVRNDKAKQKSNIKKIISFLRERNPDCSILLVSAFVPNWPSDLPNYLEDHEKGYYEIAEEYDNVAVSPVYSVFKSMLTAKKVEDYTGNMLNHPNDFGVNVYADTIIATLSPCTNHRGGTATCKDKAVCDNCGEAYGGTDPDNHKTITTLPAVSATCTKTGLTEGKKCTACNTTIKAQTVTSKAAHKYGANYVSLKATTSKDGTISKKCACGTVVKVATIYRAKTISVASSVTYTGKPLEPKVTVKDAAGKTLKEKTDYNLTYSKNKSVGKATVKVTFKGNYSGSKTLTFKIVPKKTSISSLKAGKKSLTVKFKKQTSGSGYEIQYSTSKSFKGAKTVKISKNKTVSKTIKKLKSKKTYYVRVRVVKGSYKSNWSSVKKVKVK